jgi:glucose-1-phosphate thymidylyltransferase
MSPSQKVVSATACALNKINIFRLIKFHLPIRFFHKMPVNNKKNDDSYDLVGLIPAAGEARRLGNLPCSKELLPVGFHKDRKGELSQPKAIAYYLLERMKTANVSKTYIILRKGKWDIPNYFGDGKMLNMSIAYLLMDLPFGVPFTIDQAYTFIKDSMIVFGFPDILFQPKDAFVQLLNKQRDCRADLVLGLFPANHPQRADMVELDDEGSVCGIRIKSSRSHLQYAWIIAVWTSLFTHFMHEFVLSRLERVNSDKRKGNMPDSTEIFIGDVIQAAIDSKLQLKSVIFTEGSFIDIGTPNDFARAIKIHSNGRAKI